MRFKSLIYGKKCIKVEWTSGEFEEEQNSVTSGEAPLESMREAIRQLSPLLFEYLNFPGLTKISYKQFINYIQTNFFHLFLIDRVNCTWPSESGKYLYKANIHFHFFPYGLSEYAVSVTVPPIFVKATYTNELDNDLINNNYATPLMAKALQNLMDEGLKFANGERLQPKLPGLDGGK